MRTKLLLILLTTLPSAAGAMVATPLNLVTLSHEADLIVVGTVRNVSIGVDVTVVLESEISVPGKELLASFSVDQALKGSARSGVIQIRYEIPVASSSYGSLAENEFQILFLREQGENYTFASIYRPGVSAVPGARATGADPLTRVLSMISDGLQISTSRQMRLELLSMLEGIDNPVAIDALHSVSDDADLQIRFIAIGLLMRLGQEDVLPAAVAALANVTLDPLIHEHLRFGIKWGIRSEAAVPVLRQLLQFPEVETRRAAAYALRGIESTLVVQPLKSALDDNDFEVRLSAAQGLARAFDELHLFPGDIAFRNDEERFTVPLRAMDRRRESL